MLGNLKTIKTSLTGSYHSFAFGKYERRSQCRLASDQESK